VASVTSKESFDLLEKYLVEVLNLDTSLPTDADNMTLQNPMNKIHAAFASLTIRLHSILCLNHAPYTLDQVTATKLP
jgi:hypothetical protein